MALNISLGIPSNLTYSECQDHFVDVLWSAVAGISEYEILLNGEIVGVAASTSFRVSGLTSNTNYNISVRSKSGTDWGESSLLPGIRTGTYPDMRKGFLDSGYVEIATEPALDVEYTNQNGLGERRLTDRNTMEGGADTPNVTKRYSKVPTFTADSLICTTSAAGGSLNRHLFRTSDWQEIPNQTLSTFMSYTDPKVSYYMPSSPGNVLKKVTLDEAGIKTTTDLFTFSDYDAYTGLPTEESKFSWDMRYIALEMSKGRTGPVSDRDLANADSYWAVVFDLQTNTIVGEKQITFVDQGWAAMSPSGEYVCVLCSSGAPSPSFRVYKNDGTMDEMPYGDIQVTGGFGTTGHGDFQKSIQGNDVFVARVGGRFMMYLLDTGEVVDLVDDTNLTFFNIGHVGGQNILQPGWIFADEKNLSTYAANPNYSPIYRKIFAIQLDENVTGLNNSYVREYSRVQISDSVIPNCFTCWNPTGQVVAFANFSETGIENEHMYVAYGDGWNLQQLPSYTLEVKKRKLNALFGTLN